MEERDARAIADRVVQERWGTGPLPKGPEFLSVTRMDREWQADVWESLRRAGLALTEDQVRRFTERLQTQPFRLRWSVAYIVPNGFGDGLALASVEIDDETGEINLDVHIPKRPQSEAGGTD
jgi:hypothetical protein